MNTPSQPSNNEDLSLDAARDWDVVIRPRRRALAIDLAGLWRYRDLMLLFVKRDFTTLYKQTILGPLWYLIQPTLTALTYYVVFGKIASLSTNGLPPLLFYMSGIILWTYFASCLTNNSEVFSKNAALFSKVYFPRLVVPISVAASGLVAFTIQLALLLCVTLTFQLLGLISNVYWPGALFAPLIILYVACAGMAVGLIVSALTVRFRDLAFATGFVTQLWMYGTPIVYPFSTIPERYQWFFYLNPMTAPVETFRSAIYQTPALPAGLWISNILVTLLLLSIGLLLFTKAEATAMDTV